MTSKRELGITFNFPYFIANVSLTHVHAHVYERYVNFSSYCVKMYFHQTCKDVLFCCRPGSSYIGLVEESDA